MAKEVVEPKISTIISLVRLEKSWRLETLADFLTKNGCKVGWGQLGDLEVGRGEAPAGLFDILLGMID